MQDITDKSINAILVIGNGFDLHCGLKSSFKEYYEKICLEKMAIFYHCYCLQKYNEAEKILISNKEIINFWSFLFYIQFYTNEPYRFNNVKSDHWYDIENLILMALSTNLRNGTKISYYVSTAIKAVSNDSDFDDFDYYRTLRIPYIFFPFLQKIDNLNVYDYLLNELSKFEKNFKNYIFEISSKQEYRKKSLSFVKEILKNEYFVDLISFNYSIIDDKEFFRNKTNVHGQIDNDEIIIGIDSKNVESDDLICFTKTYRNIHRLKSGFDLPLKVDKLIFYGHSLSPADYSYFHSLFDMYNLYESDLVLRFLYSDYYENDDDNEINHSKYVRNIYKLINEYSKEKRSENNLLHRLLLEGRIIIEKI